MISARNVISLALALAAAAPAFAFLAPAQAQGRLEADYHATLAGITLGKGSWQVDIGDGQYSISVNGGTTGLLKAFSSNQGNSSVRGTFANGQAVSSEYAATMNWGKKPDEVRILVNAGTVKDFSADPPPKPDPERVPVTDTERRGVLDPLTAGLMRVPGTGEMMTPDACKRTLSVFDGRMRYDLKLAFKRMDHVKAKGYEGQAVVCSVAFVPVAGFIPSRYAIRYLREQHEVETWLVPIAGTRVLVPFRMQGPTPVGEAVLEATRFVSVAKPKSVAVKTQ